MSSGTRRRGLRTKTGCLTCRNRKKKCDEKFPVCSLCSLSKRQCDWPKTGDLVDRRYASHHQSRHATSPKPQPQSSENALDQALCLRSESASHRQMANNLELAISRHFIDNYYALLLLPNCHPDFFQGWITEIQVLMVDHTSLKYSVLANGASHLHFIDASQQMQELALTYYSNALKGLSDLLTKVTQLESHNGFLMSVMLLYLHGCMGRGTYSDIPRHVNAATRVLKMRLFNRPFSISRPFDRLAVESVLYQIFLVTTGLWSDQLPLDYEFDADFWLEAEKLLDQSKLFPGCSNSLNSPVLGIPVTLFRLALSLKQHYQRPLRQSQSALEQLRNEVGTWEALVLCDHELDCLSEYEQPNHAHQFYKDASYLYILIASLLLERISENEKEDYRTGYPRTGPPRAAPPDSWQIKKATQILRRQKYDDGWKGCFIGNWPVYTLGFFVSTPDDVELVRSDIHRRWKLTKFAQLGRFINDLEATFTERGFGISTLEPVDTL